MPLYLLVTYININPVIDVTNADIIIASNIDIKILFCIYPKKYIIIEKNIVLDIIALKLQRLKHVGFLIT